MRFWRKIGKVAPMVMAIVFGQASCSTSVKLVGVTFEPKDSNKKLKKGALVKAFRQISQKSAKCVRIPFSEDRQRSTGGKYCKKCGEYSRREYSRWAMTHLQGIAMRENHVIFTSSVDDGYIAFGKKSGDENYIFKRQSIGKPYSHPGGIQTIGEWVVVPVEGGGKSEIRFYKYNDKGKIREEERLRICRDKTLGPAGSVGITNYTSEEGERYLLATIPKEKENGEQEVHFYWTQANKPLSASDCSFEDPKIWKLSDQSEGFKSKWRDYINSMSLVADEEGNIYFIGMSHHDGKDYADLYKIDINVNERHGEPKLTIVKTFEFTIPEPKCCKGPRRPFPDNISGLFKVEPSFRWGGGVLVTSHTTVEVFACAHEVLNDGTVAASIFRGD